MKIKLRGIDIKRIDMTIPHKEDEELKATTFMCRINNATPPSHKICETKF